MSEADGEEDKKVGRARLCFRWNRFCKRSCKNGTEMAEPACVDVKTAGYRTDMPIDHRANKLRSVDILKLALTADWPETTIRKKSRAVFWFVVYCFLMRSIGDSKTTNDDK